MQRLRAEVLKVENAGTSRDENGCAVTELRLGVKVAGPVWQKLKLPVGVKGSERTVTRRVLYPWQVQAGDSLLLTPDEAADVLCPEPANPAAPAMRGQTVRGEGDLDRDGFVEQCLANAYLQAVVAPAGGGRIASLRHARSGLEALATAPLPGYDGPTPGGYVDGLAGAEALATSEYSLAETEDELVAVGIELDKPFKGHLARTVVLAPETPLLELVVTIRRRGDEEEPKQTEAGERPESSSAKAGRPAEEDSKPDPVARYEPVARLDLGGLGPSNATELLLPCSDGLRRLRWDAHGCGLAPYRPAAGFAAAYDHRAKLGVALLLRPGCETCLTLGEYCRTDHWSFLPRFATWRLKPGEQRTVGLGLVLADALDATADALAVATLGRTIGGRTPLFLLVRGAAEQVRVEAELGGKRRRVKLHRVRRRSLGATFEAELWLRGEASPGTAEVAVGAERLVLRW